MTSPLSDSEYQLILKELAEWDECLGESERVAQEDTMEKAAQLDWLFSGPQWVAERDAERAASGITSKGKRPIDPTSRNQFADWLQGRYPNIGKRRTYQLLDAKALADNYLNGVQIPHPARQRPGTLPGRATSPTRERHQTGEVKHMPRQPNGEGNGGGPPPPPPRYNPYLGPNYQGFVFVLVSSSNAPTHILTISTQTNENIDAMANITGLWYPAYNPSNTINPISGYIAGNGDSQIINCWWGTPDAYHALQGTLTYNVGKLGGPGLVWPSAYLEGDVTVYVNENPQPGGPGHVSGTGRRQPLAAP